MKKYKLGDLIDIRRGASLSGEYYSSEGELMRLTLGHFDYQNGGFKENTSKNDLFFVGPVKSEFILSEGDIITPLTEQTPGLLGSTAMIPESDKYIRSQDVALITPDESKLDRNFCYYLLPSKIVKQQLAAGAQQTKIRHTTPDRIKDLTVFIPSLPEQKAIGKLLKCIDQKIALNREINRNLEAMARQLYDYWFVQFDFPDKNGKPYKSSGGKMVWNEKLKQEVPEYWTVSTIGKLASLNKSSLSKKEKLDELIYLDTSSLTENKIDTLQRLKREDAPSRAQRKVKRNTILYSTVRPRLKHYGIICSPSETLIASTGFCTIDANSLKYSFWLYLFLTEEKITNKLGDIADTAVSSYPSIGPSDIEGLQVCFGDDGLMNAFHEKVAPLFEIMESNQNENIALQKQRDELLPLLMNGQVSVMPSPLNCDLSHD